MFDIGFLEIATICVVALIVVGPERLPGMARTVGLWVGRIRYYVSNVKADIEREIRASELKEMLEKPPALDDLQDIATQTKSTFDDARTAIESAGDESVGVESNDVQTADVKPASSDVPAAAATQAPDPSSAPSAGTAAVADAVRATPTANPEPETAPGDPPDTDERRTQGG